MVNNYQTLLGSNANNTLNDFANIPGTSPVTTGSNPLSGLMSLMNINTSGGMNWMKDPFGMGTSYGADFLSQAGVESPGMLDTDKFNQWSKLATMDKMNSGPSVMDLGNTLMQGINLFKQWGFQDDYMDLAKEQMGIAREQWNTTKDELNRIKKVRSNISQGYGGYGGSN